jgi:simple sugar transport system substrate-binding protein
VEIIMTLNDGGTVEPRIVTQETTFTQEQAIEALPDRQY